MPANSSSVCSARAQRSSDHGRYSAEPDFRAREVHLFEGGEGSGKSTQIKKLAERLAAEKLRAIVTREPGGSPGAEIIRHLVLSGMGKLLGPEAETLLFAAARDDHVRTVIQPALGQGTWVLCDRFSDSTRAYQGRLGQVSPDVLNAMQRVTIGDLKPDLTIILDIPVEVGLKRAAVRRGSGVPDRFEAENIQFHQDLRDAYRQIAAEDPQRCVLIDANADADTVAAQSLERLARSSVRRSDQGQFRMSARKTEPEMAVRHPRETADLFGHGGAEAALLNAYRSGRIPHAWLIGGPQGIGKATLAYRMARFVLANADPMKPSVQRAETLALDPSIRSRARSRRAPMAGYWCSSAASTIAVCCARSSPSTRHGRRFRSSDRPRRWAAGESASSIPSTNSIRTRPMRCSKILEEPPQRSLFLLVSHSPARALPTILSRCRKLPLRPLATGDVIRAAAHASGIASDDATLAEAADASEGSVSRALTLMGGDALKLQQRTAALLASLPRVDPRELHALGDALGTSDRVALAAFIDGIDRWIGEKLRTDDANANLPRLARLAEVWEKIVRAARDTELYNLERKPLVFSVFGMLAEATR